MDRPTCADLDSLEGKSVRLVLEDGRVIDGRIASDRCCQTDTIHVEKGGGTEALDAESLEFRSVRSVTVTSTRARGTYTAVGIGLDLAAILFVVAANSGFARGL